jgi:hypothetical protein
VVSRPFAAAARGLNRAFPGVGRALARGGDAIGDGIRPVLTAARRGNAEGALDNAHPSTMGPGGGLGGRINLTPAQAQHLGQAQKDGQAIVDQVIHQRFPGKQIKVDYTTHPIDPAAADEVNRAIGRMAADYPEVFRDIKRIETQDLDALYPQQGYLAVAVPRGGSTTLSGAHLDAGVYMDAQFLGDATAATKQLIADVKSGFTFPDGGSIEAVALHEFGHQLHFRIDVVPGGPAKLDAAIENALHKVGTMKPFDSSIYDNLTLRDPMVQTAIEQHVSGYGATYSQEVIAEAFAESRLAPRPRDFAVEIRKVIDSFLPKP